MYDANGNRTSGSYTTGPNNQLLSDGVFDYAYDNEGNLIRKTEIASGNVTQFTWDHRNRLVQVQEKSSGGIILSESNYTYDVFDRRIAKTVNGQTLWTVYENNRVALPNQFSPCERRSTLSRVWADYDGAGQVATRYLAGNRPDELLARFRPSEGTAWYLADRLGSVRDIVNAAGALVDHLVYDSFGNLTQEIDPAAGDRFRFTGREFDAETGLYYYRARYYDPQTGRFISQDPIWFAALDTNLYRYVGNSPTNSTDPTGLLAATDEAKIDKAVVIPLLTSTSSSTVQIVSFGVRIVGYARSFGPLGAPLLTTFATVIVTIQVHLPALPAVFEQTQTQAQAAFREIRRWWEVRVERLPRREDDQYNLCPGVPYESVCTGSLFKCKISGLPPLTCQWVFGECVCPYRGL